MVLLDEGEVALGAMMNSHVNSFELAEYRYMYSSRSWEKLRGRDVLT